MVSKICYFTDSLSSPLPIYIIQFQQAVFSDGWFHKNQPTNQPTNGHPATEVQAFQQLLSLPSQKRRLLVRVERVRSAEQWAELADQMPALFFRADWLGWLGWLVVILAFFVVVFFGVLVVVAWHESTNMGMNSMLKNGSFVSGGSLISKHLDQSI